MVVIPKETVVRYVTRGQKGLDSLFQEASTHLSESKDILLAKVDELKKKVTSASDEEKEEIQSEIEELEEVISDLEALVADASANDNLNAS
uniref:Tubulin-specific chaperone A n=1 Tax=Caenorhabditis tropicalis TaxID=1561998 RepID=A0A1I7UQT3_9PELO